MSNRLNQRFQTALAEKQQASLLRVRKANQNLGTTILVDGQSYINFSGNDYLALNQHSDIQNAFAQGAKLGSGSTGSALINGYTQRNQEVEQQLADWLGFDAVLIMSTGFSANASLLKTICSKNDFILQDKLNHASLIDGGLSSEAPMQRFKHNDMGHLAARLAQLKDKSTEVTHIVSEGIFSMDGDGAPIQTLCNVANQHQANLIVDDAHGIGVFGERGQGSWHENFIQTQQKPDILTGTFGKAFGLSGAFVAGDQSLIDYLVNYCRSYIYSTVMPPALINAIGVASHVIAHEGWRRHKLQDNISYFKSIAEQLDIELMPSDSAIQPVVIGEASSALELAKQMRDSGFWLTAIRPPTVPANSSRIRITLTTDHTQQDIRAVLEQLSQLMTKGNLSSGVKH